MPHFWCVHCLRRACSHPQGTHLRTVFGLKKKAFCSVIKCIWLLSACVLLNRSGAYSAALSDGRVEQRWLLAQNLLFFFSPLVHLFEYLWVAVIPAAVWRYSSPQHGDIWCPVSCVGHAQCRKEAWCYCRVIVFIALTEALVCLSFVSAGKSLFKK